MTDITIIHGDCREEMAKLPECSVDAIVTDPPYEIGFMRGHWDSTGVAFDTKTWENALRILKPGGHLLAFGGARTYHRMVCAVEDAGFEIRDQIMWVFGSGFPKSKNLDGEWEGWGTALKPAHEPIVVARKPLEGTVAANVNKYGTGALNIDSGRIEGAPWRGHLATGLGSVKFFTEGEKPIIQKEPHSLGRWPANLIHDGSDEVLAAFPDAPGQLADSKFDETECKTQNVYGAMCRGRRDEASANSANDGTIGFKMKPGARRLDTGSAARFFYCAKASREDRNEGCEHMAHKPLHWSSGNQNPGAFQSKGTDRTSQNYHPTVKPTDLMAYLCRLVTPRGGLVLDPFMGSGSTGKACVLEGFRFIGIELSTDYIEIARARIDFARRQGHQLSF